MSIGPSRITKLKMKKMTRVTTSERDDGMRAIPALIVCETSPTVPKKLVPSRPYLIIRTTYTARIASTIRYKTLNQKCQNHTRRRATTSSSRSAGLSIPNRFGHWMKRWKIRSRRPRKAAIASSVPRSAQPIPQPCIL